MDAKEIYTNAVTKSMKLFRMTWGHRQNAERRRLCKIAVHGLRSLKPGTRYTARHLGKLEAL